MPEADRQAPTTQAKVAFLSTLGGPDAPVAVRETHMSWAFLGRDRVWKLKKPMTTPFLDFSTLAAREAACRAEVRLNRRLAPEVYLGLRSLVVGETGALDLGPDDPHQPGLTDWVVEMRRLPDAAMLDRAIAAGRVSPAQVDRVADRLAAFYAAAEPVVIAIDQLHARLRDEVAVTRDTLTALDFPLDHGRVPRLLSVQADLTERIGDELAARAQAGRIIEAHGDLRPEHICLTDPPVIIDCLEFNRSLRLLDPHEDLACLAVECRARDAGWIADRIAARVAARIDAEPSPTLAAFYLGHRALIRARLTLAHVLEGERRDPEKWAPLARRYLDVAEAAFEAV